MILNSTSAISDGLFFFKAWLRRPLGVASVTPSSRSLAQLITQEIDGNTGHVIELGPGTGVFTRALLGRGVREDKLVLVERELCFADMMAHRFPAAEVVTTDAARLGGHRLGVECGAVVSGLPLLSMPPRQVMAILSGSFRHLRAGGNFYQFTYGPRCPVPRVILDRLGLKATLLGRTIHNLPPAAVYRISRRGKLPLWLGKSGDIHD